MKSVAKWLTMSGSILVFLSFFLPIVSLSSQGLGASLSLLQIAGLPYQFLLYLVPLGALIAIILPLIPASNRNLSMIFLIGIVGALGLGVFILIGTLISFWIQASQSQSLGGLESLLPPTFPRTAMNIWPGISFLSIVIGYGLAGFSVVVQIIPQVQHFLQKHPGEDATRKAVPKPVEQSPREVKPIDSGIHLEAVKGEMAGKTVSIHGDVFSIGRGTGNDLRISDPKVSRHHARLRFGQGVWYIQDQNSAGGTFVNGKRVQAGALKPGDQIKIGENTFMFKN